MALGLCCWWMEGEVLLCSFWGDVRRGDEDEYIAVRRSVRRHCRYEAFKTYSLERLDQFIWFRKLAFVFDIGHTRQLVICFGSFLVSWKDRVLSSIPYKQRASFIGC
jgi:hypothetical protein